MIEWREALRTDGFSLRSGEVEVSLRNGRSHRVKVERLDDGLRLEARVARRGAMARLTEPELRIWLRNRVVHLVGFHFDSHGGLLGDARVPGAGLDAAELRLYVMMVASECDRLEELLTGQDLE
jgi:hypothetical protein